jgi:hypothetical protein
VLVLHSELDDDDAQNYASPFPERLLSLWHLCGPLRIGILMIVTTTSNSPSS